MTDRLTQPDWCNAPQPGNWRNACMRSPNHLGDHAVRLSYRLHEALTWPRGYPVRRSAASAFPDLWHPDSGVLAEQLGTHSGESGGS